MDRLARPIIDPLDRAVIEQVLTPLQAGGGVRVCVFGSRARGDARRASDIDLALDAGRVIPPANLAQLREAIEASNIPFRVDLVDYAAAPAGLRDSIDREGIPWPA